MGWEQIQPFAEAVISLFAILDPIGCLPVFAALTTDANERERRFMFRLAGLIAMGTVLVMAVVGEFILHYVFHIDFGAFMIAGGVLLVIIGVRTIVMGHLGGRAASESSAMSEKRKEQLIARSVSPLACPMIVGPGSIVASLLIVKRDGMVMGLAAVVVAFVLTLAVLNWGHLILRALGRMGPIIIARIMMIFVTAIGVQFIYNGILELFPQLQ